MYIYIYRVHHQSLSTARVSFTSAQPRSIKHGLVVHLALPMSFGHYIPVLLSRYLSSPSLSQSHKHTHALVHSHARTHVPDPASASVQKFKPGFRFCVSENPNPVLGFVFCLNLSCSIFLRSMRACLLYSPFLIDPRMPGTSPETFSTNSALVRLAALEPTNERERGEKFQKIRTEANMQL